MSQGKKINIQPLRVAKRQVSLNGNDQADATVIQSLPMPQDGLIPRNAEARVEPSAEAKPETEIWSESESKGVAEREHEKLGDITDVTRTLETESESGSKRRPLQVTGKTFAVWKALSLATRERASEKGSHMCRMTRGEIAKLAGIGSLKTIDRALKILHGMGLIEVKQMGEQGTGKDFVINEYFDGTPGRTLRPRSENQINRIVGQLKKTAKFLESGKFAPGSAELNRLSIISTECEEFLLRYKDFA